MKTSKEIRQEFIDFFKQHHHAFVPSSPVIPADDPTLLFINAGMNQFKDVFLETGTRSYKRAVNSQKCIRVSGKHNDLEEVGYDSYHHTYFEMLGNWSFGDYFKKNAIMWGWELLTRVWGIPKERLYATVFGGDEQDGLAADEEAEKLWMEVTDIQPDHILRCGKKDNFWEMGDSGPCGPCSEIHIDLTKDLSGGPLVNQDDPQVIEIWNLVFIQYNRHSDGKLDLLPSRHVDTGMGFERIVRVLQNVDSNYDTDIFQGIFQRIGELTGINYQEAEEAQQCAFRVLADHARMLTFSIADGAFPSNEKRGYVLRRILRRAARYGRKLGMCDPFIYKIIPSVIEINGEVFPEIKEKASYIMEAIKSEEESFNKTLDRGLEIFNGIVERLEKQQKDIISGKDAFQLYDTYGFPIDLTQILAAEQGIAVDEKEFNRKMEKQRERARKAGKFAVTTDSKADWIILEPLAETKFVGYEQMSIQTCIHKIARRKDHYHIVLGETPFYAESGGQIGDHGKIIGEDFLLEVIDTQKQEGETVQICSLEYGTEIVKSRVEAVVDMGHRIPITYNHTATHLLHAALREVLGDHVHQAGSLVSSDHLRFDFSHLKKIEREQLEKIEWMVNQQIQQNVPVEYFYSDFQTAQAKGAMALFGEKYSDTVRVVSIVPFSMELCGGCHVRQTGEIGPFLITQESSIASGVRRIEALTGPKAVQFLQRSRHTIQELDHLLNTPPEKLFPRVQEMTERLKSLEKEVQKFKSQQILQQIDSLITDAKKFGNIFLVQKQFEGVELDLLKQLGDSLRQKATFTVGFFVNQAHGRIHFVCTVTDDLLQKTSLKAGELVKQAAGIAGGGGGGRPHLATAGAKNGDKLPQVFDFLYKELSSVLI